MARPKDQSARRDLLIKATLSTISERGLASATMKNIADQAGVSQRLVAYYYPDLADLIAAAHQVATERYYGSRRRAVGQAETAPVKLLHLMTSGLPRSEDRLLSQFLNEIWINAIRSPLHATLATLLFDRETSLYVSVLQEGLLSKDFAFTEPVETVARNFVLLEDALGVHVVGNNSSIDAQRAEEQLTSYARTTIGFNLEAARAASVA